MEETILEIPHHLMNATTFLLCLHKIAIKLVELCVVFIMLMKSWLNQSKETLG